MPPDVQAVSRQSSSSPPSVHRPAAVSLVQTKPRLPICNLPNSALKSNSALHGHCWSTPAKPDALPRASSAWASPSGRRGPTGAGRSHTIQIQGRVPLMLMACPLCSDRPLTPGPTTEPFLVAIPPILALGSWSGITLPALGCLFVYVPAD